MDKHIYLPNLTLSFAPYRRIAGQADRARLLVGTRDQRRVLEYDLACLDVFSGDGISEIAKNESNDP